MLKAELLNAVQAKRPSPGQSRIKKVPAGLYTDEARFRLEATLLRRSPVPVAHAAELTREHPVFSFSYGGVAYLLTRAGDGGVRCFINSCAHRGTRLLDAGFHRCRKAMVCPYHNWSFDLEGKRVGTPHAYGFDESIPGLHEIEIEVRHGIIWLHPFAPQNRTRARDAGPGPVVPKIDFIPRHRYADWSVYRRTDSVINANWKILAEGGLEFYHFKATHGNTIYPRFFDNQGLVERLEPEDGYGLIMYLPHKGILEPKKAAGKPGQSTVSDYCHLVYFFFPGTIALVEDNLVNIIRFDPLSANETRLQIIHLVPARRSGLTRFWNRRIDFTLRTLDEDNDRAVWIQEGLAARNPDQWLHFGSFEYVLGMFHEMLSAALGESNVARNEGAPPPAAG